MRQQYLSLALLSAIILNVCFFMFQNWARWEPLVNFQNADKPHSKNAKTVNIMNVENFTEYVRPLDLANSTSLFNSIHSALKQKDSDIHPAGVSYFPAVIPEGTLMYHAGNCKIPDSFEWLAMDFEFSFSFGSRRSSRGRASLRSRGRHGFPGGGRPHNGAESEKSENEANAEDNENAENKNTNAEDTAAGKGGFPQDSRMCLFTFRANRDLNKFLYLDGASAAKTDTGEMDTQQLLSDIAALKLNLTNHGSGMAERLYAENICKWGKPYGLHGIIRVEIGFEIVLCDFLNGDVELVSNVTSASAETALNLPPAVKITKENGWPLGDDGQLIEDQLTDEQRAILDQEDKFESFLSQVDATIEFDHVHAGAVHDTGDKRIQLDYRYLVSGFNRTWLDPNVFKRRLLTENATLDLEYEIVEELENTLSLGYDASESNNWQLVTEEIVDKFSPLILSIEKSLKRDADEIEVARNATRRTLGFIRRFVHQTEDFLSEHSKDLAVYQYTQPLKPLVTDADYLIWSALVNTVRETIDTLYYVNTRLQPIITEDLLNNRKIDDAKARIDDSQAAIDSLKQSLGWIAFSYRCDKICGDEEICYTPSWGPGPFGWITPDSTTDHLGMTYDEILQRQVIQQTLQCISIENLLNR